jgi:hypothetical protein
MEENIENSSENKPMRDELGRLLPGYTANPNGRPEMTEAEKLIAKAKRDFVKEYKESLRESLPLIKPVLIAMALEGNIQAIKELNDRAMGKAESKADITSNGETIASVINIIKPNDRD